MEKLKIEMNNDMTLIIEHVRDKITAKVVMGTEDDIDEDDVVVEYEPIDEQNMLDVVTKSMTQKIR